MGAAWSVALWLWGSRPAASTEASTAAPAAAAHGDASPPQPTAAQPCPLLDLPDALLVHILHAVSSLENSNSSSSSSPLCALFATCRATARLVLAHQPRATLHVQLSPQRLAASGSPWTPALAQLLSHHAPLRSTHHQLRLVIQSLYPPSTHQLTPLALPPAPFHPLFTHLSLRHLHINAASLAALQLHAWRRLTALDVDGCRYSSPAPPNPPLAPPPRLERLHLRSSAAPGLVRALLLLAAGSPALRMLGLGWRDQFEPALALCPRAPHLVAHCYVRKATVELLATSAAPHQHVTLEAGCGLDEDLSALSAPTWRHVTVERAHLLHLARLPLLNGVERLVLRARAWDARDAADRQAALRMLGALGPDRVRVEPMQQGDEELRRWRLDTAAVAVAPGDENGARWRMFELWNCTPALLRFVLRACPRLNVLLLSGDCEWAGCMAVLQLLSDSHAAGEGAGEGGGDWGDGRALAQVHTLCLWASDCAPAVAAALPRCVTHLKVCTTEPTLGGVHALARLLPPHVRALTVLHARPPDPSNVGLAMLQQACAERGTLAPLRLVVEAAGRVA